MAGARNLPKSWSIRRAFWNWFSGLKYKGARPANIPVPIALDRQIKAIPLKQYYPRLNIANVLVADHIPKDESSTLKRIVVTLQTLVARIYSPMQPGLQPIPDDPQAALDEAYPRSRHHLFPPPRVPEALRITDTAELLGRLAVEGPFACYLEAAGDAWQWDTRYLNDPAYQRHPGLEPAGTRVTFAPVAGTRALRATAIETHRGTVGPDDPDWSHAVRLALCGLSGDISIVRHFNWLHLAAGSGFAIATRNCLSAEHPLRRLLWPHMYRTQYSNDMITETQNETQGDFPSMFSYTPAGVHALIDQTYKDYRADSASPRRDAARRGLSDATFDTPSQDNLVELFDLFQTHTTRYVNAYFDGDEAIACDQEIAAWVAALDQLVPNGVADITGGRITRAAVAELAACLIYVGSVQHEVRGTNLWYYQLWTHIIPCRVYENGQREPVDVYQRLVNANLNLNIHRAQLMRDFGYLAVDQTGRDLFAAFLHDLQEKNAVMRAEGDAPWRIYPDILEANINA